MATKNLKTRVTLAGHDVRKEDTKALLTGTVEGFPEDVFANQYATSALPTGNSVAIIAPQYAPGTLYSLITQNNILSQCVEVMEVNIDGTGHSIDLKEDAKENETEKVLLENFFNEPYPGKSMISIRRSLRRDMETTGNGYLEVIRNAADEIAFINHCDATITRLLMLDAPVMTEKEVMRGGKQVKMKMHMRERRFVQEINQNKTYFKQFGSKRDLDKDTGKWAEEGRRLPIEKRASELIHFTISREPKTPYGSPRWINQLPSILGSRKAEEYNVEFFDAGGLPPVLLIIQGGTIGDTVKEQIQAHLSGKGAKHRAAIVEATSTSGTLDSTGSVQVKVERFGAERQQDAMFQTYDDSCSTHVRTSFRLPPLFTGQAGDYSFATAYASYLVAEAQVFWPERELFDSVINHTIAKELGSKDYRFRSLPLSMVDVQNQLKALEMVADKHISGEELVAKLNEIVGLGMQYEEQKQPEPPQGKIDPLTSLPYKEPVQPTPPVDGKLPKGEESQKLPNPKKQAGVGTRGGDPAGVRKEEVAAAVASILDHYANDLGLDELCECADHLVKVPVYDH